MSRTAPVRPAAAPLLGVAPAAAVCARPPVEQVQPIPAYDDVAHVAHVDAVRRASSAGRAVVQGPPGARWATT